MCFQSWDGKLYALESLTGRHRWNATLGFTTYSSPTVDSDAGVLFIGLYNKSVRAYNASSGALMWSYATKDRVMAAPTLLGPNLLLVGCYDFGLHALNRTTGARVWMFNASAPIYSTAAVDVNGAIFFTGGKSVFALNRNGGLLWSLDVGSTQMYSSPAIGRDGVLYVGTDNGGLYAFWDGSERTQEQLTPPPMWPQHRFDSATARTTQNGPLSLNLASGWSFVGGRRNLSVISSPCISAEGNVVFAGDMLYSVNSTNAKAAWSVSATNITTAAIGRVGLTYAGSSDGRLLGIDTGNGGVLWAARTNSSITLPPVISSTTNMVYVTNAAGKLVAVDGLSGVQRVIRTVGAVATAGPVLATVMGVEIVIIITGRVLLAYRADTLILQWSYEAASNVFGVAVDSTSKLFFASDNGVASALDATNGSPLWGIVLPGSAAVRTSPALPSGTGVLYACDNGFVVALDRNRGDLMWQLDTLAGTRMTSPIIDAGGFAYISADNGIVYCVDALQGTLRWRFNLGVTPAGPVAMDASNTLFIASKVGTLHTLSDAYVWPMRGFDANHTFRSSFNGPSVANAAVSWLANASALASPVSDNAGRVFTVTTTQRIVAYRLSTGADIWSRVVPGVIPGSLSLGGNRLLYATSTSGLLYAFSVTNGKQVFTKLFEPFTNSSALNAMGSSLLLATPTQLFSVDKGSGNVAWSRFSNSSNCTTPAQTSIGLVLSACNGTLIALNATTGLLRWRYNVTSNVSTGTPFDVSVATNARAFAAYSKRLLAFNSTTGALLWTMIPSANDSIASSALVIQERNIALVTMASGLVASYNASTGALLSSVRLGFRVSAPAIGSNGLVYFAVSNTSTNAVALNLSTNSLTWNVQLSRTANGSVSAPIISASRQVSMVADGALFHVSEFFPPVPSIWGQFRGNRYCA